MGQETVAVDLRTEEQKRLDAIEARLDAIERHLQDVVACEFREEQAVETLTESVAHDENDIKTLTEVVGEIDDRTQD